jgi:hypothetical protein
VQKPLQLRKAEGLTLEEVVLFDKTHEAESLTPPSFKNGDPIEIPGYSATLLVFRP